MYSKNKILLDCKDRLLINLFFTIISSVGIDFNISPVFLSKKNKLLFWLMQLNYFCKFLNLN